VSELSNLPSTPAVPLRDSEPAEVTEFFDHELEQHREQALRARRRFFRRRTKLSVILFALTCVSVFAAGVYMPAGLPWPFTAFLDGILILPSQEMVVRGIVFTACLMAILLAHEMGHFLQAVRHRILATLPFFIPFPINPFGTMGAVIVQDGGRADRRQLFDIAISGPLAGLVVALPVLCYGVATSRLGEISPPQPGHSFVWFGDPLLVRGLVQLFHGPSGPNQDIALNAPLFAGWVGIFITALNLMPVGQLDGGHILYTLIGKPAHRVALLLVLGAGIWMALQSHFDYVLILIMLIAFGIRHPPTANDQIPLGVWRTALGWLMLAFVFIGFTPQPIIQYIPFVPLGH
jgi:membrane-associated protease RseP (regulator of RpoE activity)